MLYKITGTRGQFDILSETLDEYTQLYNGHLGCVRSYCLTAFYKRADKTKLTNQEWLNSINKVINLIIEEMTYDIKEFGKTNETEEWKERHVKNNSLLCRLRTILDTDIIYENNGKVKDKISFEFDDEELSLLSTICNEMSRMICGQSFSTKCTLTSAWYNIAPRSTDVDDCILRNKLDTYLSVLHTLCWHSADNELDGVNYDENSDTLFDMHHVFRHALWEDREDDKKSHYTVDAYSSIQYSKFDLVQVERIIDK